MAVRFNEHLLLWGFAVVQPATAAEAIKFIAMVFPEVVFPSDVEVQPAIDRWVEAGQLLKIDAKRKRYSLTSKGNNSLTVVLRRARDKARLFLLKNAHAAKVVKSEDAQVSLTGDSPAVKVSSAIQGARPISAAAVVPLRDAPLALNDGRRAYWPRVIRQLNVGSEKRSSDTFYSFFSFRSLATVHSASDRPGEGDDLSITDLGVMLGISPRLLTSFIHKPERHYRQFSIGKRGGGLRKISSPRIFLKVIQYWLVDHLLYRLRQHPSSHAYKTGHSIQSNAAPHVGQRLVANVDIKDFFPSIRRKAICELLVSNGFGPKLSQAIASLTSLNDGLPQGAPSSPVLSNAYLFDIDERLTQHCLACGVQYTRYADDITLSGSNRDVILSVIRSLELELAVKGLQLNGAKTRIASRSGQQKVTGVVVNEKAQPPRELRRRVRAMFHQATLDPVHAKTKLNEIRGYVSYFKSYAALRDSASMRFYDEVLARISG